MVAKATTKPPANRVKVTLNCGVTHTHDGTCYQVAKDGKGYLQNGVPQTGACTIEAPETLRGWLRDQGITQE